MTLQERINAGLSGNYKGLNNGFNRLNNYIFGIQKSTYTLIGGLSGTFKTTLCDFMILNAIADADEKGIELDVFYYSFEIDKLSKQCNWLSYVIYQKYDRIISPEKIKGLGDNRLTEEELNLVNSEIPYIEKLFERIKFRFKAFHPTGIYNELWKHCSEDGEFNYINYQDSEGETKQKIDSFKPNNPKKMYLVILDHLLLLKKERGFDDKQTIDKYSAYCLELRNMFGVSFINVSQFNDGLSSVDRAKFKGVDLSPQMTDFKSTRNPYADADVVIGIMNPYKLDMDSCLGYDITRLKDSMIMLKIIKNRLSKDNIAIGVYVDAKGGVFKELPRSSEMTDKIYKQIEDVINK